MRILKLFYTTRVACPLYIKVILTGKQVLVWHSTRHHWASNNATDEKKRLKLCTTISKEACKCKNMVRKTRITSISIYLWENNKIKTSKSRDPNAQK